MSHRRTLPAWLIGLVAVLAFAVLAYVYASQQGRHGKRASASENGAVQEATRELTSAKAVEQTRTALPSPSTLAATREAASLVGRVLDEASRGIAGAEVSLAFVTPALREERRAWRAGGWGGADFVEIRTSTDAQGGFALKIGEAGADSIELVVWASLPGYRAGYRRLPRSEASAPLELRLEVADAVTVRVLGPDGAPAVGARVEQRGETLPHGTSDDVFVAPILFCRDVSTDAGGLARISAFPGLQVIRAVAEGRASAPVRIGPDQTEVELRLGGAFEVLGTAVRAPSAEPPPEPERTRLAVRARVGAAWRELAVAETDPEGSFGPMQVPLIGAAEYELRVEGIWYRPQRIAFAAPEPGEEKRFDVLLERGFKQWLLVLDEDDEPVADARGELLWIEDGETQRLRGLSRGDGYIPFVAAKGGSVVGLASAPGYAPARSDRFLIPTDPPETITVTLGPAAELTGRVVDASGRPVSSFQVIWHETTWNDKLTWDFHDREDGRFHILAAPRGGAFWYAAAPEGPGSEPVFLDLGPGGEDVELVLKRPLTGRGRVVDAATGAPVSGARALGHVMHPNGTLVRYGSPVLVGADGSFALHGCIAGLNEITIEADGYGSAFVSATAGEGGVDFGTIELQKRRALVVELEDETGEGYQLDLFGMDSIGALKFPPSVDGVSTLVVPDLSPGRITFSLRRPESSSDEGSFDMRGGARGFRMIGSGGCTLDVSLAGEAPSAGKRAIWVRYEVPGLRNVMRVDMMPPEGRLTIPGLPDGTASIQVYDAERMIGRATATCVRGRIVPVVIQAAEEKLQLSIVGSDDAPIVGAIVPITPEAGPPSLMIARSVDEGLVTCSAIPPGRYFVTAEHGEAGLLVDVPVDVRPGPEPTSMEIRLDGKAGLRLRVVDDGEPVAGVRLALLDRFGISRGNTMQTGTDGLATHAKLHAGTYRVRIDGEGVWRTVEEVEATASPSLVDLEVRRLGDLLLELRTQDGVPISGAAVALTSLEDGADVGAWIEQGLVTAPGGLETDARGRIELEGLPRGDYRWELGGASGLVRVVAGKRSKSVLVVGG